jgi:integrase
VSTQLIKSPALPDLAAALVEELIARLAGATGAVLPPTPAGAPTRPSPAGDAPRRQATQPTRRPRRKRKDPRTLKVEEVEALMADCDLRDPFGLRASLTCGAPLTLGVLAGPKEPRQVG